MKHAIYVLTAIAMLFILNELTTYNMPTDKFIMLLYLLLVGVFAIVLNYWAHEQTTTRKG